MPGGKGCFGGANLLVLVVVVDTSGFGDGLIFLYSSLVYVLTPPEFLFATIGWYPEGLSLGAYPYFQLGFLNSFLL